MVDGVMNREYLGRSPLKACGAYRLLEPRCEGILCLTALPHGDGQEVVTLAHTCVANTRPSASGMGDPLAQRALYFSSVTAGGRYTTAIAMAVTSLGSSEPTTATWIRRRSVARATSQRRELL